MNTDQLDKEQLYYKNKYLKYKNKYLALKKQLDKYLKYKNKYLVLKKQLKGGQLWNIFSNTGQAFTDAGKLRVILLLK